MAQPTTRPVNGIHKHRRINMQRTKRAITAIKRRVLARGFISMTGDALYLPRLHKLRLTISFKRSPLNYGQTPLVRETIDWKGIQADGSIRKVLEARMDELDAQLTSNKWPEQDMFLETCSQGRPVEWTLSNRCSVCACWYCEVAK
jgi:hypothetical protein